MGEDFVTGVKIKHSVTAKAIEIPIDGFFVAVGHKPNSDIFADYLSVDEQRYIITVPGSTQTNVEGVFACGDVQDKNFRQAVTAARTGCMAALEAETYLVAKELEVSVL